MDETAIVRSLLHFFKWLIIEVFIQYIVYGFGYVTLKVLTLGRYPQIGKKANEIQCIITGFILLSAIAIGIAFLAGSTNAG